MPNANYLKGRRLEMEIVNAFRKAGYNAVRAAGSHSKRDVFVWLEKGDIPKAFRSEVVWKLKFIPRMKVVNTDTWVRTGKKYEDWLHCYSFCTAEPLKERMYMFQCKRKAKK